MAEIPDDIRKAAHDATRLPLAEAFRTSPAELIDLALDAAAPLLAEAYEDLLGCIWLHVDWRWLTKQVTTGQKELWAGAVERWSARLEPGEPFTADRWWRDDA